MSLKNIMGNAFKEDLSVEEIIAFFEGNDKIINLSNGGYVSKSKFDDLNSKHQELSEKTKDYEVVKTNYQNLLDKQEKDNHLSMIKKYVKPEFSEFAYFQLKNGNLINDNFENNVKEYVKTNSQYGLISEEKPRVINTGINTDNGKSPNNNGNTNQTNQKMNDAIRGALK